jgi:hypothetical protein
MILMVNSSSLKTNLCRRYLYTYVNLSTFLSDCCLHRIKPNMSSLVSSYFNQVLV